MRLVTSSNCVDGLVVEPDCLVLGTLAMESYQASIGVANLPLVVAVLQDPCRQPAPLQAGKDIISR